MATQSTDFEITLGVPITTVVKLPLLTAGGAGTINALRILTHPDSVNFPPIVYSNNPDLTSNLIDEVLPTPISSTRRTIGTTLVTRFTMGIDDVIVDETWNGTFETKAAMPGFFLRLLYNYLVNPPVINPPAQTFIQWAPRDVSDKVYNVDLFKMTVGSGSGAAIFDLKEIRFEVPPVIDNGLGGWDVPFTGMIDQNVVMSMKIVSEVP